MVHSLPSIVECRSCGNREVIYGSTMECPDCGDTMDTETYTPFEDG